MIESLVYTYRSFHNSLPKSGVHMLGISVRHYEMDVRINGFNAMF